MKTRILKKLTSRVRIRKQGRYYIVESRYHPKENWKPSPSMTSFKKALLLKHTYMRKAINDAGLFVWFKDRRKIKVNSKRRFLSIRGKLKLSA